MRWRVFEGLDATLQGELVQGLKDDEVGRIFADLDPDDRVGLLDELPATVARRLLRYRPGTSWTMKPGLLAFSR